ncbi:MAG TPA: dephospho-CoA kinase [Bryobacteraceae bacterium]|nr:dephospho-CoA kinase [Bryobacteraceae bacterium]
MLKVGLTGGLATGKSFVGKAFAALGCRLIHADEIGRAVMRRGGEAFEPIVREFGKEILAADGSIDRRRLAAVVFSDPARLDALNRLVHPLVIREQDRLLGEIAAREPGAIAVVEAAVMIEAGTHKRLDKVVVTTCREEQQAERAVERGGLTREEALARIRRQIPLEEKRQVADYVIDTSGSEAETLRQVREVYNLLRGAV